MKIGCKERAQPAGMVPVIWTCGYRMLRVKTDKPNEFNAKQPMYHPFLQEWGPGQAFYWSENRFPRV